MFWTQEGKNPPIGSKNREIVGDFGPREWKTPDRVQKAEKKPDDFGPGKEKAPDKVQKQRNRQLVLDPGREKHPIRSKSRKTPDNLKPESFIFKEYSATSSVLTFETVFRVKYRSFYVRSDSN